MIIIIDILIIFLITIFSIYNGLNKKLIDEVLKLCSLLLAILINNITGFYKIIGDFLINQVVYPN